MDEINNSYIIECFKTSREELLTRVKYRDNWLKYQLISMLVLLAISSDIEVFSIKSVSNVSNKNISYLFLSLPISTFISLLYFNQNYLIGKQAKYIASLSDVFKKISNSDFRVLNWDAFYHKIHQGKKSFFVYYRLTTIIISFTFLPLLLTIYGAFVFNAQKFNWLISECLAYPLIILNVILNLFLCWRDYKYRKDSGEEDSENLIE